MTTEADKKALEEIQRRFETQIPKLPETIEERLYSKLDLSRQQLINSHLSFWMLTPSKIFFSNYLDLRI